MNEQYGNVFEYAYNAFQLSVKYTEDVNKTDAQKAQARANINAASADDLNDVKSAIDKFYAVGEPSYITSWTSGTINNSGNTSTSDTKYRTGAITYAADVAKVRLEAKAGYTFTVAVYTSQSASSAYFKGFAVKDATEFDLSVDPDLYYRYVIGDSAETPAEDALKVTKMFTTDKSLTQTDKAADAKIVGDAIRQMDADIYIDQSSAYVSGWTSGYIKSNGSTGSDSAQFYCGAQKYDCEKIKAVAAEGYTFNVFEYTSQSASTSTFVKRLVYAAEAFEFVPDKTHYYRYVVTNGTSTTPGDVLLVTEVRSMGILNGLDVRKAQNDIFTNIDISEYGKITPVYNLGSVATANADNSGGIDKTVTTSIYSEEIYVGGVKAIKFTPDTGITYRVAAYDKNHTYARTLSLRTEQSAENTIYVSANPRTIIKYIRIVITSASAISDIDAVASLLSVNVLTDTAYYLNDRIVNNKLLNSMSHQGYNPTSGTHANPNRMTTFWGAYQRGFDTILCNVRFTSDNVPILNHDTTTTIGGTTYTIASTTYATLAAAFESANAYLPTFDDICWFCKMTGMELFSANGYAGTQLDILWGILKKYQMQKHMMWLLDDNTFDAVLAKDSKARVYFYLQPSGSTASAIAGSIATAVSTINNRAEAFPNAEFNLWLEPVAVSGEYSVFGDALVIINATLKDNVFTGVCNVNSVAVYKACAPYMSSFHSDFYTSGNLRESVKNAVLERFPIIGEYINNM